MCNKCPELMEHVVDNNADVMLISETWLKSRKNDVTGMVKQYGYILHHSIRKGRRKETGGGVGILVRKSFKAM